LTVSGPCRFDKDGVVVFKGTVTVSTQEEKSVPTGEHTGEVKL
jgi:hypothetical protein